MLSFTEENYLKAIYTLVEDNKRMASTNEIAELINTKAPTVTDMLKRLSKKEYIEYKPYQGVTLSEKGLKSALRIVRKHRLWETFLVNKLGFGWDEVHEIAEELEHIKSDTLINRLEDFLGQPTHDPHGDPIPDRNLNVSYHDDLTLSDLTAGQFGIVIGLKDTSPDFLKFLVKNGLTLGQTVNIKNKNDFDNSLDLTVNMTNPISISHLAASNIYIKKLSR